MQNRSNSFSIRLKCSLLAVSFLSLVACQDAGPSATTTAENATGFQNHRTLMATFSGKSVVPDNNGLAFYFAPDGILHTKSLYHNGGPKNTATNGDYMAGKPKRSTRPALMIGDITVPAAPALCIEPSGFFVDPDGPDICVTLFRTPEGNIYVPETNSFMTVSEGPAAFQAMIHNEGQLRDLTPPIPPSYGNIRKYGGVGLAYTQAFPDDLVAQNINLQLRAHVAEARAKSRQQLDAEIATIEARYAERAAQRERLKIAEAQRVAAQQRQQNAARRAAREERCKASTGRPCTSGAGGLTGWLLNATLSALTSPSTSSGSTSSSIPVPAPTPTQTYTLICREQGLLTDLVPTISSQCSGSETQCKADFEESVSAKYGSMSSACSQLVRGNWYNSHIRVE